MVEARHFAWVYTLSQCFYYSGLMAFDYILEYDEWIECGYFSEEIVARLKGIVSSWHKLAFFFLVSRVQFP